MKKNIQAFPVQQFDYDGQNNVLQYQDEGMTLLDYFAAKAMQGFAAGLTPVCIRNPPEIAEYCYLLAKAMLAEREKAMKELSDEP